MTEDTFTSGSSYLPSLLQMKTEAARRMGHVIGVLSGIIWFLVFPAQNTYIEGEELFFTFLVGMAVAYVVSWCVIRAFEWVYLGFVEGT